MSGTLVKKILFLSLAFSLPTSLTLAQDTFESPAVATAAEIKFKVRGGSKDSPTKATLKLTEKQNLVYLYFEASELPRGSYQILKATSCADMTKKARSKKPLSEEDELYSFDTKYGNISGEKNLTFKNLQELEVGKTAFALVKVEKGNKSVISCTTETSTNNKGSANIENP